MRQVSEYSFILTLDSILILQVFQRARDAAPAIIFFDEIDALAVARNRSHSLMKNQQILLLFMFVVVAVVVPR